MVTARALAESILPGCEVEIHSAGEGKSDELFEGAGTVDSALSMAAVAARLGPASDSITEAHRTSLEALARLLNGNGRAPHSIFDDPTSLSAGKTGVSMSGPLSLASTLTEDLFLEYADGMSGERLGWGRLTSANLLDLISLHTS
jgi:4-phytase/acid phosphatase